MSDREPSEIVNEIAREASDRFADIAQATWFAEQRIAQTPGLIESPGQLMARQLIRTRLYAVRHEDRVQIAARAPRGLADELIASVSFERHILATWKIGNKVLGDCFHEDVAAELNRDAMKRDGYGRNVVFYRKILDETNPGDLMKESLSDSRVAEMLGEAIKEISGSGHGRYVTQTCSARSKKPKAASVA